MKNTFTISALAILFVLSGCRKPSACINVSTETPSKNQTVSIDGFCSERAKWYAYEIDGQPVYQDTESDFDFAFTTVGPHTIKLTVYRHFNGTYNSQTGCSGCSGSGKSSSTTKTINVVN